MDSRISVTRDRLAAIEGVEVSLSEPLARHTTLRIGGPAEIFARVESETALCALSSICSAQGIPVRILGQGSNILIPDEGLAGLVLVLEGELRQYRFDGSRVEAGGGVVLARLAKAAAQRDWVGLEALAGFPSTVGGAVVMNAGCYGAEIKDLIESVVTVTPEGELHRLTVEDLDAGYRRTRLLGGTAIVSRVVLRLESGDGRAALLRMSEINRKRRASLPSGHPNAGSTFMNPPGDYAGRLIEACGLKGACCGGAEISDEHANVIVNRDRASAEDVLSLMLRAFREVKVRHDVALEPELILAGGLEGRWRSGVREIVEGSDSSVQLC